MITRGERLWALGIALAVIALTVTPYVVLEKTAPPGWKFMGSIVSTVDPVHYQIWIAQARDGNVFFQDYFTPERAPSRLTHPLWLSLGLLCRWTGLSPAAAYHGSRVVLALLLLVCLYSFLALFLTERRSRLTAFAVLAAGGGFGWAVLALGQIAPAAREIVGDPLDLSTANGFIFSAMLLYSHFVATLLLLLAVYAALLRGAETGRRSFAIGAGLAALLAALMHPYSPAAIAPGALLWAAALTARGRGTRPVWYGVAAVTIGVGLGVGYQAYALRASPVWSAYARQDLAITPPIDLLAYLLGYGVLLALLLPRAFGPASPWRNWREKTPRQLLLPCWLLGQTLFLVAVQLTPYRTVAPRFLEGLQVPLGLLAIQAFINRTRERPARQLWGLAAVVAVSLPTSVVLVWRAPHYQWTRADGPHPYYLYDEEFEALRWLRDHVSSQDVVLSAINTGQWVPRLCRGARVYLGQPRFSLDQRARTIWVQRFFSGEEPREDILRTFTRCRITWVFWGPAERAGSFWDPRELSFLQPAYANDKVMLLRVAPETRFGRN